MTTVAHELPLDIEPDEPTLPNPELDVEPDEPEAPEAALAPVALMQVLPADFPLPALIKFVPNRSLLVRAVEAAAYAEGLEVVGVDGLQRADLALTTLRDCQKAIEEHFAEPVDIANKLHKGLTGTRAEWTARGKFAIDAVGRKIFAEKRRLDDIAAAERRKAQEEADRLARAAAAREAEAAAQAQAPAPVVEELKRQAQTATAAPVAPAAPATQMRGTSVVTTWKARITGTPGSDDQNPDIEALTPAQRLEVLKLLKAILDGRAPLAAISLNWSYLNKRAKADKSTLQIPGIDAYEDGGVRAKGSRSRSL